MIDHTLILPRILRNLTIPNIYQVFHENKPEKHSPIPDRQLQLLKQSPQLAISQLQLTLCRHPPQHYGFVAHSIPHIAHSKQHQKTPSTSSPVRSSPVNFLLLLLPLIFHDFFFDLTFSF